MIFTPDDKDNILAIPLLCSCVPNARFAALTCLQRVDKGIPSQAALDTVLRASSLQPRDAALTTELVYGVLRTEIRLKAILARFLAKPHKLPADVHSVLHIALYATLFLTRIPAYASFDWAVGYVRDAFGRSLANVVNAVLRTVQRTGESIFDEHFYAHPGTPHLETIATLYAVPLWMARLWHKSYGEEAAVQIMARVFAPPWTCVRLYPGHEQYDAARTQCMGLGATPVGVHGYAFSPHTLPSPHVLLAPFFATGALTWQAAGSLEVLDRLPIEDAPWWDACAGQGGKTLALIERGSSVLLCSDVHKGRLVQLQRNAARLGIHCPPLLQASCTQPSLTSWQGNIVLDVPCSGLGTLARRPEIRRRSAQSGESLVRLQGDMLHTAWRLLGRGQCVAYITCTLNPQENEAQVANFLQTHADACCEQQWQTPHSHPWLEGMYVAVVRKV